MDIIKTKRFELAVNKKGDISAEKVVICLPGRLDTKDYACFTSHLEYLANKGFFAIAFDPPGTWDSPGSIDLYNTTNYVKAVNELIEYFGNKPTLLMGHSRGGAVSILASTNPNVIGIVMIMAAYGDPSPPEPDEIRKGFVVSYRDLPPADKKTEEKKRFELPVNYWLDSEKHDVLAVLKSCTKPKLLFSGTNDEYYTPQEVQEIYDSIPDPKMLHELNSDHDYRYHPEIIEAVNKITGEFLDKYYSK